MQERCEEIFREVEGKHGFRLHEIGFDKNHVHLSIDLGVDYSVAGVAKLLKGTSGYKLLRAFPEMKRKYFWGSGMWGSQVYFDSTGQDADRMRVYVRNQVGGKSRGDEKQQSLLSFIS